MFDFLFSNPFILIIIIAVISSIFKKRKPAQMPKGKPQAPKPVWKEIMREIKEEIQDEMMGEGKKATMAKPFQAGKKVAPTKTIDINNEEEDRKRIAELKQLQQEYEREMEMQSNLASAVPKTSNKKRHVEPKTISDESSPVYNKNRVFGKQELLNGIIMAEILSPPKSKRRIH